MSAFPSSTSLGSQSVSDAVPTSIDVLVNDTAINTAFLPLAPMISPNLATQPVHSSAPVTLPSGATVEIIAGQIQYTPNPSYVGTTDTFSHWVAEPEWRITTTTVMNSTWTDEVFVPTPSLGGRTYFDAGSLLTSDGGD